jgi:mono/diheme cytochrome c family protein
MKKLLLAAFVLFALVAQAGITPVQAQGGGAAQGDPANGAAVFRFGNTSCSNCHGAGAVGGWGPDLAGKGMTVARAVQAIRKPVWKMPAFDETQVTDKEIIDMVAYWNSLPPTKEIGKWRFGPVMGNAPWGQQLATNIVGCVNCHGLTLETPRHGAGEVNGDFEWFKNMVYNHSTAQPAQWKMLDREKAPSSTPAPGRVRMGNYSPQRLPESTLREIWDWVTEMGILVPVSARITAAGGEGNGNGTTYTVDVANGAVPNKGLTAEDVTVTLNVPMGMKAVSGTGAGYKATGSVVTWKLTKLAPMERQKLTVVLSGAASDANAVPRGKVSWAKPTAREDADVEFALPRPGGRGAGD